MPSRLVAAAATAIVALAVSALLAMAPAQAQSAATVIEISDLKYQPDGQLMLTISGSRDAKIEADRLSLLVDGNLVPLVSTTRRAPPPSSVLIAIDASESVRGAPLAAATEAARNLIDRIGPTDAVALLTFSDRVRVVVPFTTDRAKLRTALAAIKAEGNSGLYDAVEGASRELAQAAGGAKALVLLSSAPLRKGEEIGGISTATRSESIARARESGARVFTIGLGLDPDALYLRELSDLTGGTYQRVTDPSGLNAVFGALGDRLHPILQMTATLSPLSEGPHSIEVRVPTGNASTSTQRTFDVSNAGLLKLRTIDASSPGDAIVVVIETPARQGSLEMFATLGGQSVPLAGSRSVTIDPWAFPPGSTVLTVGARSGGRVIASVNQPVTIPALEARLTARVEQGMLVVRGRAQNDTTTLVVANEAGELARGEGLELRLPVPPAGQVTAKLIDGSGRTLQQRPVELPAVSGISLPLVAGIVIASVLIAVLGIVVIGRARRATVEAPTSLSSIRPSGPGAQVQATGGFWSVGGPRQVRIQGPSGVVEHILRQEAVTLGRQQDCDIVLDDPAILLQHARLTLAPDGMLRVQTLGTGESEGRAWSVLAPDDEMVLGAHVLRFVASTPRSVAG